MAKKIKTHGQVSISPPAPCGQIKDKVKKKTFCQNLKKHQLPETCSQLFKKKNQAIKFYKSTPKPDCSSKDANFIYNQILTCLGCEQNNNNSGLSGGAIAGIVVGSVVGLALIIFLIYKYKRKWLKRKT
jgi:hypothetical protein